MKNKKGVIFTILAITMLSLFAISFSLYSFIEKDSTNYRIKTMNNFVFSIEQDLPRQLYISGYRGIFLMQKRIIEKGEYINNVNQSFNELFFNGTLNGIDEDLMNGAKFIDIQNSLNEKASKMNAEISFYNPSIKITQENPWNVKIILNTGLLIKDKSEDILWNKTKEITSLVSIENFEDPLYIVNTNGMISNKFNKTIYNLPDNLYEHLENRYYINSTLAPSFLNRFEGNLTKDENGIESLVYLPDLSNQGISIKDKSCVDYIYFSSSNPSSQIISGMPSWFKLDNEHITIYT